MTSPLERGDLGERAERLRELAKKATPGPWEVLNHRIVVREGALVAQAIYQPDDYFIAACSPENILALLTERDEQQRLREKVVCLCGSTRFAEQMNLLGARLTLNGYIVVRPEVVTYSSESDPQRVAPEVKAALDELHLRKIDLASWVFVVNVGGYIGESTAREVAYARSLGKRLSYLIEPLDADQSPKEQP